MKNFIIIVFLIFCLGGCTQWQSFKTLGATTAQQVADEALRVTLWQFCKASSIGSIERWAGGDQSLADARKTVCGKNTQADVIRELPVDEKIQD